MIPAPKAPISLSFVFFIGKEVSQSNSLIVLNDTHCLDQSLPVLCFFSMPHKFVVFHHVQWDWLFIQWIQELSKSLSDYFVTS